MQFTLFEYNIKSLAKVENCGFFIGFLIMIHVMQISLWFLHDVGLTMKQQIIIAICYILTEWIYFLLNVSIAIKLSNSGKWLKSMFHKSIFLNIGVISICFFLSPFILLAFFCMLG